MKRRILTIASASAILILAGVATAQPAGAGRGMGAGRACVAGPGAPGGRMFGGPAGGMMLRAMMSLDLTTEQRQSIQTLHTNAQKEIIRKQADLRVKQIELGELMGASSPNRSQIEAKVREIGTLRTEIQLIRTNCHLQTRSQLTAEQIQQLQTMCQQPPQDFRRGRRAPRGARGWGMMAPQADEDSDDESDD